MDKNSLIIEIKNDINSIKKQVDVTLAKLDVLEALIKLEIRKSCASESRGRACSDYAERSQESPLGNEELGVKEEPTIEPVVEAPVVTLEPIVEPEPVEEKSKQEIVEIEQVIELEIEEKEEIIEEENEEEITTHSSLLTPNCEEALQLRNLMSVIGLNDRFRFRHDLFSNSDELFRETIDILNKIENFDSAVDYLMKKFAWDEEDATVVYFYDIIKPKF